MIQLTNTVAQTVAPGQAVTFNTVQLHSGCGECHTNGSPFVKLRAKNGTYNIEFSGNISGTAAGVPVQLAIALGGFAIPSTVMVSTPSAANAFNNISTGTFVKNDCGDFDHVTVINTGTVPVLLSANTNLRIIRLG